MALSLPVLVPQVRSHDFLKETIRNVEKRWHSADVYLSLVAGMSEQVRNGSNAIF